MKPIKNTLFTKLKMQSCLCYYLAFALLLNISHIKGTDDNQKSYSPIQNVELSGSGIFPQGEKYKILIKSAPAFVKLSKRKRDNSHLLRINSKLFRYATEEDPLIVSFENIVYTYKYKNRYKQKVALGTTKLKIGLAVDEEIRKKDFAEAEDKDRIGFMSILEQAGTRRNPPKLTFKLEDRKLSTTIFKTPYREKNKKDKKIKKFHKLFKDNKSFTGQPALNQGPKDNYDVTIEIDELTIQFPKKEEKINRRLILGLISAAIVAAAGIYPNPEENSKEQLPRDDTKVMLDIQGKAE